MNGASPHGHPRLTGGGRHGRPDRRAGLVGREASVAFGAVTLAVIAGACLGLAAVDGRRRALVVEGAVCALFAGAGLARSPLVIPAAIVPHGGWDLPHGFRATGADVPG